MITVGDLLDQGNMSRRNIVVKELPCEEGRYAD